jgi:RHS repeat-associated protein
MNLAAPARVTYRFNGQQVAVREGVTLTFVYGDHLGSASLTANISGAKVSEVRYYPYGETRYSSGNTTTSKRFNAKEQQTDIGLYDYGARFYDPALGRFISADSIVPKSGDPQSLNRYSYALNSPLKYSDPSGHDPFTPEWDKRFTEQTKRNPEWFDRMLYLFSIAFPDEYQWDATTLKDSTQAQQKLENYFRDISEKGRDWKDMPDALGKLAAKYEPNERNIYMRDIASLFGGLQTRWEAPWSITALVNQQVHQNVYIRGDGLSRQYVDSDADGNVHHWAAFLLTGYVLGGQSARDINHWREGEQAKHQPGGLSRQDLNMGDMAGYMGQAMGSEATPVALSARLRRALAIDQSGQRIP